ncbi:MAG: TlpA family protein disulfide reductase [Egibacteraceae bacterium]
MTTRDTTKQRRRGPSLLTVALVAIPVLASIALVFGGGGDSEPATGAPTVSGQALPAFTGDGADPAVGMAAPEVEGAAFDGGPVAITRDGTAKIIVFLAHWCPHCQREVPAVNEWLEQRGLPEGVELYSVVTSIDPSLPNYPPDEWLRREGWSVPVLADDARNSVATAYGLNAFPYWVFVTADGTVAQRATGELPADTLERAAADLAPGTPTTTG